MKVVIPCSAELTKLLVVDLLIGNWYFPNGSRIPSASGGQWDIYRTRDQMVVSMHRRRGGVEGI